MSGQLPDEIIREILTPALKVSSDSFCSTAHVSPFSGYNESTSALLVVCKSWLRVSTPLLYHVVVLRSKAQANALERALRGNQLLGTFIKKLRVEGGLGPAMERIIKFAPNITDLCLTPAIWSSDNVSGLCRGLPSMKPRHVIVCDSSPVINENAPSRQLLAVLCQCIGETWTTLVSAELPYTFVSLWYPNPRVVRLCKALATSSNLTTLILRHPQCSRVFLERVTQNSSLQVVRVVLQRTGDPWRDTSDIEDSRKFERSLQPDDKLKRLLCYEYPVTEVSPTEAVTTTFNSLPQSFSKSFVALQTTPDEIKHNIWDRIIYFSLLRDPHIDNGQSVDHSFYNISSEHVDKVLRVNILLVSKLFEKMAMQHFYRCSIVTNSTSPRTLECLRKCIFRDSSLGPHLRSLFTHVSGSNFNRAKLRDIVAHVTGLIHLRSPSNPIFLPREDKHDHPERQTPILDFDGLQALSQAAGSTLETLTGQALINSSVPKPATPLYAFIALRTLEWESSIRLEFDAKAVPADALATLESLSYTSVTDTFLSLLGCMNLPALKHVAFPNASKMAGAPEFLQKHGTKLATLKTNSGEGFFALCPALDAMYLSNVPCFEPHATLTKIVLTKCASWAGSKGHRTKSTFGYLGEVDFGTLYPALQEIQVYPCKWPTTERDITTGPRSNWVSWSERLMAWNIRLTDLKGKHWRSRLK